MSIISTPSSFTDLTTKWQRRIATQATARSISLSTSKTVSRASSLTRSPLGLVEIWPLPGRMVDTHNFRRGWAGSGASTQLPSPLVLGIPKSSPGQVLFGRTLPLSDLLPFLWVACFSSGSQVTRRHPDATSLWLPNRCANGLNSTFAVEREMTATGCAGWTCAQRPERAHG